MNTLYNKFNITLTRMQALFNHQTTYFIDIRLWKNFDDHALFDKFG
ncbi:unnamed protein product [Commensalibacter communis]|nr:unnamed protein product [Commensalibacter communis]